MIQQINVSQLKDALDKNPDLPLLDVRETDEYTTARAPQAKLVALSEFNVEKVVSTLGVSSSDTIYIICKSGGRSMRAAQLLEQAGFTDLVNIAGGTSAWIESGFDTAHG